MNYESKSKYVEFVIEDSDYINDIMEEWGIITGRGTVSYYDNDNMAVPEYDHSFVLEWENSVGEKRILVGDEHDAIFDEIFDCVNIYDFLLADDGEQIDISDYASLSIEEMLGVRDRTEPVGLSSEQFNELMSRLIELKEDSLYRREINGDTEVYPRVNGMIPYLEAKEIILKYVIDKGNVKK